MYYELHEEEKTGNTEIHVVVRKNTCTTIHHHLNTCNGLTCFVETVQNSYQLFSKFSERCSRQSADIQLGSHLCRIILRVIII